MIVGPIQFASPFWLVLILPLVAMACWISRRSIAGLGGPTRWVAFGVRVIVIVALCSTLAEPNLRREGEGVATIVIVDGSASMPRDVGDGLERVLAPALDGAGPEDRIGLVSFAQRASARRLADGGIRPEEALQRSIEAGDLDIEARNGSDIADALRTGLMLTPSDATTRLLLVSDGNETQDSAIRVAQRAAALGVPIDVWPIVDIASSEVVFEELIVPHTARLGQTISVTAMLNSKQVTRGRLSLTINGRDYDFTPDEPGTSIPVVAEAGLTPITIPVTLVGGGAQRFSARFEPDDEREDQIAQNNFAQDVTFVQSEGRVLLYAEEPNEVASIHAALIESGIDARLMTPGEGPRGIEQLQVYDAIILFDTAASDFDRAQQRELAQYVRDTGGGLLMIGGPNSFGAGGWIGSPVADVLPVRLDVPERRNMPKGALAIVVDTSGSMAAPISGTNLTQLDAAEEGAIAAINALSRLDLATVLRFDTSVQAVLSLQEVGDKVAAARAIRSMSPGGGTSMFPGIRAAMDSLERANVGVRHIVVLSDGMTGDDGTLDMLLRRAVENSISISTVSIGDGRNDPLMANLAAKTGGLFHPVTSNAGGLARLPQIFVKEAQIVRRALIWEGDPITPVRTGAPSVPMRSIPTPVPAVSGYVVTTDREGLSVVTLRAPEPDEDPILAQWQHGLGRAMAFTSDAAGRWAPDWVSWGAYRSFWEQHVRWCMRPTGSANLSVITTNDGPRTRVSVIALNEAGDPMNFARFSARVISPSGSPEDVRLEQAAPGRYEGTVDTEEAGSHLVTIAYDARSDGTDERGTVQASISRSFAEEFKRIDPNPGLLTRLAEISGGRVLGVDRMSGQLVDRAGGEAVDLFEAEGLEQPIALRTVWIFFALASAAFFLSDVAVRRVRIVPREILASVRKSMAKRAEGTTQVDALRAAREKATHRLEKTASDSTKKAAKAKFEAAAPVSADVPIITAKPPAEPRRTAQEESITQSSESEDGMSRLLAAKRRAHADRDENDAH